MLFVKIVLFLLLIFLAHGYLTTFFVRLFWKEDFPIKGEYFLTFDDGPSSLTLNLIRLLEKHQKKAIFFLLGEKLSHYDLSIYKNQTLACHGYKHVNFALLGPYRTYLEFKKAKKAFQENGIKAKYFRAPYGLYNLSLIFLIKKNGMKVFQRDYLLGDWKKEEDFVLYEKLKQRAKDKNVLVLHDGTEGAADLDAKDKMLKELEIFLNEEGKEK